ncbi:hypothetical protein [Rheinheimera sp. UJ63]|uniref:hypothetical protein n=1 Tax=Rheinheimera sp. UJ63 TaxID=2910157 RepID=UPI001F3217D7|nr:hypothetical protein [Rheinheimera sp. UJ63]MCF4010626.1 hypothetical protein [Rheinheimera sp. UJ63]
MKLAHAVSLIRGSRMHVNLVTSCVSAKKTSVGRVVGLADTFSKGCGTAKEWLDTLSSNPHEMLPIIDLYKGDHWSIAKNINTIEKVTLWVISAGLGFSHHTKLTRPYDATFNKPNSNFVGNITLNTTTEEPTKNWWALLHGNKNAFRNFVEDNHGQIFIFCASERYLVAIENDLVDLVKEGLFNKENFLIITSKNNINTELFPYILISKEKFSKSEEIKGSMVSLNIRLARYLIQASIKSKKPLRKMIEVYKELELSTQNIFRKKANKLTDSQVMCAISKLPHSSLTSPTSALKALRKEGMSCEQKRFSTLFKLYIETRVLIREKS